MKRSIRTQILSAFLIIMTGAILLCWFLNSTFLERYYLYNKQQILLKTYHTINKASAEGDIQTEEFQDALLQLSGIYNVSVIVIDSDAKLIQSSGTESDLMMRALLDRVFKHNDANYKVINNQDHFVLEIDRNPGNNISYIQMWGTLENGNLFMIRSVLESIHDSVLIANRFLAYVGLLTVFVSAIVILYITKKITNPILKLTDISKSMAQLNFEVQYTGDEKNEIGELGQHMNVLSDKLKGTISELKTANNELKKDIETKEQNDEMRREFLSNVSHELKTPLALIMGYAEGLKENIYDADSASREFYCDVIIDESNKMNDMVKKLLTLNQLEFGNDVINFERFDICELISNYIGNADILIKQNNATVKFTRTEAVYVWSDEFKVEEVFANYFSNALHHLDGERVVEIKIEPKDGLTRVSVINSGEKIPENALPHLFEKFYKVDKARTREYGGNGIGLSIVKAIMDSIHQEYGVINHNGRVEFWFELPTK